MNGRKRVGFSCLVFAAAVTAAAEQPPPAWIRHYNGPANQADSATKVALGPGGTVTVVGPSEDAADIDDIVTVRYDADGNPLWENRYDGDLNWFDLPEGLGVDAAGNAYVFGTTWGGQLFEGGTHWDYVLIKYNADGSTAWVRQYDGPGSRGDLPTALAVDAAGNSYVAGFVFKEPDPFNRVATHLHVAKYDTDGVFQWEVLYDLDPHFGAGARDIRLAPDGNIVATGVIGVRDPNTNTTQDDILTLKISPQGQVLWVRQWDSGGSNRGLDDTAFVRTDRLGNVYTMGFSFSDEGNRNVDATLLKYSPDGTFQWAAFMDFVREDGFSELVDDEFGNLYLSGGWNNENDVDGFLVSFTPDGQERWRHVYDDVAMFDFQEALGLMRGPDGLLYVGIDWQYDDTAGFDFTVAVHDTNGNKLDQWRYDTGSDSDTFIDVGGWAIDGGGAIHIAGYTWFAGTGPDFTVLKVPTAVPGVPADLDGDGDVDLDDLTTLLENFQGQGVPSAGGDVDGDGDTDLDDLTMLLQNFGT